MIEQLLHPQLVQALGWTLLHSLWQGAAFALLLATLLIALRSYTAEARYTVSAGLLAAFFLTVGSTFWQQWQQAEPSFETTTIATTLPASQGGTDALPSSNLMVGEVVNLREAQTSSSSEAPLWKSAAQTFSNYYSDHLPLLVTFWLMGVLVLQLRFLGQLAFVQRLKHYGTKAFPEEWASRIDELEEKLRIQKKVVYRTTLRSSSPMVIGWLKPVILFPQLMFNKLNDTEIYAVLAHELAHVRRNDFVVNLLQTLLTNVFFFHPGVWWMSNQVDEEREHCCDDLAIIATGEAMPYAKTLLNVSQLHRVSSAGQPHLAMAMSGTDRRKKGSGFADRVKRLFSTNSGAGTFKEGFATAIILCGSLGLAFAFTSQTEVPLADHLKELSLKQELRTATEQQKVATVQASSSIQPITTPSVTINQNESRLVTPISPLAETAPAELTNPTSISSSSTNSQTFESQNPLLLKLLNAVISGNQAEVIALINQGAPVNGSYSELDGDGVWSPLLLAASENNVDITKLLIDNGADINWYRAPNSSTALSIAAGEGNMDCLITLLKAGANINGFGESLPPLHAAAAEGKTDIMRALITRGANVNVPDAKGRTALMVAASEGKEGPVALLISSLADPNLTDATGMRALEFALEEDATDLANFLGLITDGPACETHLKEGHTHAHRNINESDDQEAWTEAQQQRYNTNMQRASRNYERQERARERAERAAESEELRLRHEEADQHPPSEAIIQAIESGNTTQLENLLQVGGNANARNSEDRTVLSAAILKGNAKAVELLLLYGADAKSRSHAGWTPLHFAALDGNPKILELLLARQPNLNARANYSSTDGSPENSLVAWDYEGATPLLIAIENNDAQTTRRLLEAGADPDLRLKKVEYTRLDRDANGFGLSQVTNLRERSRNRTLKTVEYKDWTPRLQAVQMKNPKILGLLK